MAPCSGWRRARLRAWTPRRCASCATWARATPSICASAARTAMSDATGARPRAIRARAPRVSTAAVATDDDSQALRVSARLAIPLSEIALRTSRSSGPGGQHANVTASRVEASFDVLASTSLSEAQRERLLERAGARIATVAQDDRSQTRNRELALA